ncbi:YbaK/EbsC family protein [Granulicatella seriolae]|uniref:Prolyl-tRNA synthetase associated domain-containing protein n=1 Tax=Granulicatella seriolae TaxID=2967226 RepID=A0ABT1WLW8_9LACT|nr:YbaK/EbsC family protein [Granulicatella seriolae]
MDYPSEDIAYQLLSELDIPYERLDHIPITSVQGLDFQLPGQQVKNLVLKTKKSREIYLVILRDEKQADLKRMAERLEKNRLSFANPQEVENLLHAKPGFITPFGLLFDKENKVQVVIDTEVDRTLTVGFHPFVNTTTLNIAFTDFLRVLDKLNHPPIYVDL